MTKGGLNPCLVVKAGPIDHFNDQMRAGKNFTITVNKAVLAQQIANKFQLFLNLGIIRGHTAVNGVRNFRLGARARPIPSWKSWRCP